MTATKNVSVHLVPIFEDNYVFVIEFEGDSNAVVIDPGDAQPVIAFLKEKGLKASEIWLTHHHWDHIDGVDELRNEYNSKVVGSSYDQKRLPNLDKVINAGETVAAPDGSTAKVIRFDGHTIGHIAYYFVDLKILFSGDTLFGMGCGRLFEGTPEQMQTSLKQIAKLPPETQIYCTHEYTRTNGRFAAQFESNNTELNQRISHIQSDLKKRTVPLTLSEELATNPFFRTESSEIKKSLGMEQATSLDVFTELRERRNTHR